MAAGMAQARLRRPRPRQDDAVEPQHRDHRAAAPRRSTCERVAKPIARPMGSRDPSETTLRARVRDRCLRAARPRRGAVGRRRPMQHEPGGEPRRRRDLLAGAHQMRLAGRSAPGHSGKITISPARPAISPSSSSIRSARWMKVTVPLGRTMARANLTQAARSASPSTVAAALPGSRRRGARAAREDRAG